MPTLLSLFHRRLLIVGGLATVLAAAIVWAAWSLAVDADARRLTALMRSSYEDGLEQMRRDWQRQAQLLRAEIEFLRLGELPAAERHSRLHAFLNAQAEWLEFSALMFTDAHGIPFLTRGCPTLLQQSLDLMRVQETDSVLMGSHCVDAEHIYSVTATPLWLGSAGRGMALYGVVLDNARLARLAQGEDLVYLYQNGRIYAASAGSMHLNDRIDSPSEDGVLLGDTIQVVLPVDPRVGKDGPVLVIRRPLNPLFSIDFVIIGTAGIATALLTLLWFGLARDLRRHVRDIDMISQAADAFQRDFRKSPEWYTPLKQRQDKQDEIGRLAQALDRLFDEAIQRQKEQAAHQQTLELLEDVVLEMDREGRVLEASDAWSKLTGQTDDPRGTYLAEYLHPEDAAVLTAFVGMLSSGEKQTASARLRLMCAEGRECWVELRLARTADGESLRGVLRDITQSYLQERHISHMALHDALTGLPNRVLLEDRLKVALQTARRSGHKVALGFIDLDHFKEVNDHLGHKTGDQVLVALSERLRRHLRAGDTLARWGGDEFVVLLPNLPESTTVKQVAEKLRQAIDAPVQIEDVDYSLTFSAGFAIFPDDADTGEALLAHADRAMFYAKAQGRNNVQFYGEMSGKGLGKKDLYIQQRLATAIREKRILPHYQPQIRAADGHVVGFEALARWFEPEMGWISPATFIPMAETLGLIRPLGEVLWHRALHDMAAWKDRDYTLAINVSKRQLFIPLFADKLLEDVEAHGIKPQRVTLEITESIAMMDVDYGIDRLRELHAAGFRLAIDDFGVGYSSLSILHQIPVDELKIDQSFIRRLHEPQGLRMVQIIVAMAKTMGLLTTAEGVEDAATAELLRELGVDVLQGWHFARAMPPEELSAWLQANAASKAH